MKNKNQNLAVFVGVLTIAFFFLFGHIFSRVLNNDSALNDAGQSDLSFVDMSDGSGQEAVLGKEVSINFVLRTSSGETVASSLYSGPITFVLGTGQSMAGLEKAIVGMKVSGKRVIVIPPMYVYAYNELGPVKSDVPLVFEVELLSVK